MLKCYSVEMYGGVVVELVTFLKFWKNCTIIHRIGSWVGPEVSSDLMRKRKILPLPGIKLESSFGIGKLYLV